MESKNVPTLPRVLQQACNKAIHVVKSHFESFGSGSEDTRNVGFDVNIAGTSIEYSGGYYGEWGGDGPTVLATCGVELPREYVLDGFD